MHNLNGGPKTEFAKGKLKFYPYGSGYLVYRNSKLVMLTTS